MDERIRASPLKKVKMIKWNNSGRYIWTHNKLSNDKIKNQRIKISILTHVVFFSMRSDLLSDSVVEFTNWKKSWSSFPVTREGSWAAMARIMSSKQSMVLVPMVERREVSFESLPGGNWEEPSLEVE